MSFDELRGVPPQHSVATLAGLANLRSELDRLERDLIASARDHGASWSQIAAALGLRSRQAAEQRWLRLNANDGRSPAPARLERRRQRGVDELAGPAMLTLRSAVRVALRGIEADPGWDALDPRADLVRNTLDTAVQAPPGAMFSLVSQAMEDLDSFAVRASGSAAGTALDNLRAAWTATHPLP
jgi:hypothetical protein